MSSTLGGDADSKTVFNTTRFLKIGLAAWITFTFIFWVVVGKQPSVSNSIMLKHLDRASVSANSKFSGEAQREEKIERLPLPQPLTNLPSRKNPFVFFHLRKCGGSALRPAIAKAALRHNLTFLIPCLEDVGGGAANLMNMMVGNDHSRSCNTYSLDFLPGILKSHDDKFRRAKELSVVAGHFYYPSMAYLTSSVSTHPTSGYSYNHQHPFSCIIMIRDPVEQFLSCYQERFQNKLGKKVSELPLEDLKDAVGGYTEPSMPYGCSNEIARFVSPSLDDERVNKGLLSQEAIQESKRYISQCTIGNIVDHHNDTLRVIEHWHPWLRKDYSGENNGHRATMSNRHEKNALTLEALTLIRQGNSLGIELYEFSMRRFDRQVKELNGNTRAKM